MTHYAGARGKTTLTEASKLGAQWVAQPKVDGQYAEAHTDSQGIIRRVVSRNGRSIKSELLGHYLGTPNSIILGELESHTERGIEQARARGYQQLHAFDAAMLNGASLQAQPYSARRDALYRAQASNYYESQLDTYSLDTHRRAHDRTSGAFVSKEARGWKRLPIVPQVPASMTEQLWADYVSKLGGEGLVMVNTMSKLGARGSKRKLKPVDTLDCIVLQATSKRATVMLQGNASIVFTVGSSGWHLSKGTVIAVAHEGWYSGQLLPKFPRVQSLRSDLQ